VAWRVVEVAHHSLVRGRELGGVAIPQYTRVSFRLKIYTKTAKIISFDFCRPFGIYVPVFFCNLLQQLLRLLEPYLIVDPTDILE